MADISDCDQRLVALPNSMPSSTTPTKEDVLQSSSSSSSSSHFQTATPILYFENTLFESSTDDVGVVNNDDGVAFKNNKDGAGSIIFDYNDKCNNNLLNEATAPTPSTFQKFKPILKWVAFICYLLTNGGGMFIQRVEVYKHGREELTKGTFIAYVSAGMLTPLFIFGLTMLIRNPPSYFPVKAALTGLFTGILCQGGHTFFMLMTHGGGEASLLAPLSSLWAIVPALYFLFFTKEKLSINKAIGLLLAITAIVLFAFASTSTSFKLQQDNLSYFICIIFSWGVGILLLQKLSGFEGKEYNAGYFIYTLGAISTALITVFFVFGDFDTSISVKDHVLTLGGAGFSFSFGNLLFILMCKTMPEDMAIISPLASNAVLVPIILGIAILHESTGPLKIGGIVAAVIGVPLMAYKRRPKKLCMEEVQIEEQKQEDTHDKLTTKLPPSLVVTVIDKNHEYGHVYLV
eukprot:m.23167 g.23167  ORF g.23167 m.23167 type:complete len:461 (-) comp5527_c0_seq1:187-1569(-)